MSDKLALGLVIGGAVSSTVGAAFKDVEGRIGRLDAVGAKARVLERTIGDTMRLREEWRKAHSTGAAGASTLLSRLEANLQSLKDQGVEVRRLDKAYQAMGRTARSAELKAKGTQQIQAGVTGLKSAAGEGLAAGAAVGVATKVSADYGAIIRDIAIKAGIAKTPEEDQVSRTIITTARNEGMARNQVADVVNALVGAGMDLKEAMSYAPVAAKFVVGQGAEGTDTARMINALGQNAKITDPKVMQQALEAIAYQGQAGSFEASDMARWFPEMLAGMGKIGITGMDAVTQLGSMLQVQMKTAGGADEAANNLKNWMEKIGSGDTVKAYKDVGIDYQGSMNTGLQKGMSTLESSFALAQKYIEKTDPKKAAAIAEATAKIGKEADPTKAKAMMASLEQALRTGDLFADMQVKGALTAYMQNKQLYDQLKKDSREATGILDKNLSERRSASAQIWRETAQSLDDGMRSIGDALAPVTDGFAKGVTSMAQGLGRLSDESPQVVAGIGAVVGGLIALKAVVGTVKIGRGLLNLGKGSLLGNPNIPQKVIVMNMPAPGVEGPGGVDAGTGTGKSEKGKEKSEKGAKGKTGRRPRAGSTRAEGAVVRGAGPVAAITAVVQAADVYQHAQTRDEKAEGYGNAAGTAAGGWAGAAAGAGIGTLVLPGIGTAIGAAVGGALGAWGGGEAGAAIGKTVFGGPDAEAKPAPQPSPLLPKAADPRLSGPLGPMPLERVAPRPKAPSMMLLSAPVTTTPEPVPPVLTPVVKPVLKAAPPVPTAKPARMPAAPAQVIKPPAALAPVVKPVLPPAAPAVVVKPVVAPATPAPSTAPSKVQAQAAPMPAPAVVARVEPVQPVVERKALEAVKLLPEKKDDARAVGEVVKPVLQAPRDPGFKAPLLLPEPASKPRSPRADLARATSLPAAPSPVPGAIPGADIGALIMAMDAQSSAKPEKSSSPIIKVEAAPAAAPAKIDQKFEFSPQLNITVQGDVKDPEQLARELQPYLQRQLQDFSRQMSDRSLFDAPHL